MPIGLGRNKAVPEAEIEAAPEVPIIASDEELSKPLPWLARDTQLPRGEFTPRSYLDRPDTLQGVNKVYDSARMTFNSNPAMRQGALPLESMAPISESGEVGEITKSKSGVDRTGNAHVTANVPRKSMALVHTHPIEHSIYPSPDDFDASRAILGPNFEMSGDQMYVATPTGDVKHHIKVADIEDKGKKGIELKWAKDQPLITIKPSRTVPTGYGESPKK